MKRLSELVERHGLPADAAGQLERLLEALAAEPDPPTTVRDPEEVADVHLADSLVALELPEVRSAAMMADIGSGAGFPGLPLAVALPSARVDLVEATRRKAEVIGRLAAAAGVANARPTAARVEEWGAAAGAHGGPAEGRDAYDLVTARAVAPLAVLAEYAAPLLREGGALVAWKGARDAGEERAGTVAAHEVGLEPLRVEPVEPYAGSRNRHLHLYAKVRPTPERFPRRPGMAAKRPLA